MISKWERRYLELAKVISSWSKDPGRQVGAIAIGEKGQVLSQGYNGFPRGVVDSEERYRDKVEKYSLVVHAEMNVVYNASYSGVSLAGSTLYVYGLPVCNECAKGIIQVGIKRVVVWTDGDVPEKWLGPWEKTKMMFSEAGVECSWFAGS